MSLAAPAFALDVEALRRDFPILSKTVHGNVPLCYLDNAASTQRPRQVIEALVDVYENDYANVHRGIHWLSDRVTDRYEAARAKVQRFLGAAAPEEIIFVRGTTEAINLVARSWGDANCRAGDEIVLSEMEHHANLVPWQQLSERTGVVLRHIPITDDGLLDLSSLDQLLGPRTKLVAVTAVSNVLGTITPVGEIARRAHAAGALLLVDAAQAAPHLPIDVQAWNADFVAFSGHKLLGPSGIGALYGRAELLRAMPPFMGGGSMIRRVQLDRFEPADLPAKFEAGTPAIAPAIGLGAAIDYFESIGRGLRPAAAAGALSDLNLALRAVHEHELRLTRQAHALLADVGGVRFLGPSPEQKGGIVSFTLEGLHAHDVAQLLDRHGVAVRAGHHCTMPLHKRLGIGASVRASFYLYNTPAEVEKLAEALSDAKRVFRRG
jgi:cysteine desulfurase/selenocysteine lyase